LWVGNAYYVNIASQVLLYAIFALGVNVLVGYAGLVTLGHAGLFGIAAYAAARLVTGGPHHLAVAARALRPTPPPAPLLDPDPARTLRRARGARRRARLRGDHGGHRPDRVGRRLSLDQPHQRRQRDLHQGPAEPLRPVPGHAGGVLLGDPGGLRRRARVDG